MIVIILFLVLSTIVVLCSTKNFYEKYVQNVQQQLKKTDTLVAPLLTDLDIKDLPTPVQKYIRYSGAIGKPQVTNFNVRFSGGMRKNEHAAWMPFLSEQFNFMNATNRHFFMKAWMKHLPVAGYHYYLDGKAFMDIRLFSLIKVQYQDGTKMDVSETVTFFNDMCCMAPATLIDKRIKWLEASSDSVKAEFTHKGIRVSAWLHFNKKGELTNFISDNRYALGDKGIMNRYRWSTPLSNYQKIDGHRLATYAEVIYSYPEGDFCYGTFKLLSVKYNCK
jgi:hypothetical protein